LLLTAEGEVRQIGAYGALLGTFPEVELHDEALRLEPGASLVLFTDGVIEAGEPRGAFGLEGLSSLLASSAGMSANEIAERIDTAVVGLSEEPPDDVAVVVLRVRG
jgi:serine phosphatase RsbU (regulator of sigma subunit)